jgi:uncharacterized protein with PIN domain
MKRASFHFSDELLVFLKQASRSFLSPDPALPGGLYCYNFNGPQSVKHLIEAAGVPHTEVSEIQVNGNQVGFSYQILDGDLVYIKSSSPNLKLLEPRFVLDNHLGKLASHMRMLGFDCLYQNNFQDPQMAKIAAEESRILLTRDHRLLMRKNIEQGYWLRSQDPRQQLKEVLTRFALFTQIKPFLRCMNCNQLLSPVPKEAILHQLEPLTRLYFTEFHICPGCQQVYWKGSHYLKMLKFIQEITDAKIQPSHT